MTVSELIEYLKTQPQDLTVLYAAYSEYNLLGCDQIEIVTACFPRPDGWVANSRPDRPEKEYLLFPGN